MRYYRIALSLSIRLLTCFFIILFNSILPFTVFAEEAVKAKYKPGSGFTWESPDGDFSLTLTGRLELRHTYWDYDEDRGEEDVSDFTAERVRIQLKGKAFKEWKYGIQADFGKGGARLKDGYVEWDRFELARVTFGQFKVFFDRQQKYSSYNQTFVDRSLAATQFGIARDIGMMLSGVSPEKILQYNFGIYNGEGEGKHNPNNGHFLVGHVSFNPNGDFGLYESDIKGTKEHLWFLDAGAALNSRRLYEDWDGDDELDETDTQHAVLSAGYRHAGFFTQAEYYLRRENPDVAGVDDVKANGWYAQAGYMIQPEVWEVAGRYSIVDPDTDVEDNEQSEVIIGVNRFLRKGGHNLKLGWDLTQLTEKISTDARYRDLRSRLQMTIVY